MDGVIVAVIAVAVIFGAKRLPEMARSIGRAQGEFKKGVAEGHRDEPAEQPQDQPAAPKEPPASTGDSSASK